jgi:hypothetical protein
VFVKYFKISLTIYIHSLLLHVSATHGPSSGNLYYWGDHCTVHFVFCALRHIVVLLLISFVVYSNHIFLATISVFFKSYTFVVYAVLPSSLVLHTVKDSYDNAKFHLLIPTRSILRYNRFSVHSGLTLKNMIH